MVERHTECVVFIDSLVNILRFGEDIGYEGPARRIQSKNHTLATKFPNVISQSIDKEIAAGHIKEIPTLPASKHICSPLGLVPKMVDGTQTGWQTIFDLSFPHPNSVNDGVPTQLGTLSYESLETAIKLVAKHGRHCKMLKRDIKPAFRHIPIAAKDHWPREGRMCQWKEYDHGGGT